MGHTLPALKSDEDFVRIIMLHTSSLSYLLTCLSLSMVMASPGPGGGSALLMNLAKENQTMNNLDFDSQSLSKMFQKVNGFFNKTGEIMRKVAEATDNDDIKDIGDKLMLKENDSFMRLFVDDDSVDEVTDGFQRFVDFLPTIKNKVSEVLNKVPEIKEILSENVQMIPAKDDIKTKIAEILDQLPADDERVEMIRETLEENIDKIPENAEMMELINMMAEVVPGEEEIHSGLDMIVEQLESVVEELNETEPAAAA